MSAGHNQPDEVLGQRAVRQLVDREVPDHVVDAVQGLAQRRGQGLGRADTHRQRTDQAGPRGDRDRIHVSQGHPGLVEGGVQRGQERLQVRARRDLRNNATVAGILIHRCGRAVDQQLCATHQADTSFVAR